MIIFTFITLLLFCPTTPYSSQDFGLFPERFGEHVAKQIEGKADFYGIL
jgi:hypothetical protein